MAEMKKRANAEVIVDFEPIGRRVYANIGQTILAVAKGMDLFEHGISAPCGGKGLCGRCLIRLITGQVTSPSLTEENILTPERLSQGYRLACQARIVGPCKIEIPVTSLIGRQQLQVDGCSQVVEVDYLLKRYMSVATPGTNYEPLGLAIDLGTTKIAAFLIRLTTGEMVVAEGILNPQIAYGEDLMSRLAYALEDEANAQQIVNAAVSGINELAKRLTLQQGLDVQQISQAVIVANTAMHHLLLGLPIRQLATSPYVPATTSPIEIAAETIGLTLGPQAQVYFTPPIGGFVGGDHVAMIQATGIDKGKGIVLGIDIGTNTEIALSVNGERISCCSCASGPAFEGAHISQGMRAVNGAISEVKLFQQGKEVLWQTIGDQRPIGLCGSGIIDLIAELNKGGIISANGRLNPNNTRVRIKPGKAPEFIVVSIEDSGCDSDIVITQNDIGEIQLAKAAIASGISSLLNALNIRVEDVDRIVIAGAFGSFLRLESAITIGMLPDLPLERFEQVGNAAGAGACMSLVSSKERRRAEAMTASIEHLDLALQPNFKREFAKALKFPRYILHQ